MILLILFQRRTKNISGKHDTDIFEMSNNNLIKIQCYDWENDIPVKMGVAPRFALQLVSIHKIMKIGL